MTERPTLTVSQLTRQARALLEDCFPAVWVEGEVSNFNVPASGHWYFTLKDDQAQVSCAMFRSRNRRVRLAVAEGRHVRVRARVSLYEPRGQFQLIVEHLEEAGLGALQRAFEALKARLQEEGLFADERKQPLPALPAHVGVITSGTGAAIRDILHVLARRFPAIRVTVIPVPVQGEAAPAAIVHALALAARFNESASLPLDALILGRGGGSLEDLWPFNDEAVARAIADCPLPVVSAVGHETDVTISDWVADARAPTPSAAAEMLSPDQAEWRGLLDYRARQLTRSMRARLDEQRQSVDWLSRRLRHPREQLQHQAERLRHQAGRLQHSMTDTLQQARHRADSLRQRLWLHGPAPRLTLQQSRLDALRHRLGAVAGPITRQRAQRLRHCAELLHTLSPLATLNRGYAIVRDDHARVLRDSRRSAPGDAVTARLASGTLACRVEAVHHPSPREESE